MGLESQKSPSLEEVEWSQVRSAVKKVNPEIAEKIDALGTGKDFTLYRARYPFGSTILNKSTLYVPHEGKLVSLQDDSIPEKLKEDLQYGTDIATNMPLGLCINNTAELYMEQEDRVIPFSFFTPGKIFGLWSSLDLSNSFVGPRVWSITAGARSIFLLPKITDTPSYKKLCKSRGLKKPVPRNLLDHGPILADMANHSEFSEPWHTEILFFPKKWLEKQTGEAWSEFYLHIHESAWKKSEYWRNKVVYDYMWDSFVRDFAKKNIKISPYIVDIVEHLMMVGLGVLPGFKPAVSNCEGPIESLQKDFIDEYRLRYFAPTIMVPAHLSEGSDDYIYWSMQIVNYFESFPKPRTPNSIISDLREVINLLDLFVEAVLNGKIPEVVGTPFHEFLSKINFDFFHSDVIPDDDIIRHSKNMPKEDKRLIKCSRSFGKRTFSEVSPFVRGCVRISFKNEESVEKK